MKLWNVFFPQVGLAGSSAIVTATLQCLMSFFRVTDADLPKEVQPQFVLDVEVAELKINAGLQVNSHNFGAGYF